MTTDRKKALLYLSLTLIIGILIGTMVPSLIGRIRHGKPGSPMERAHERRQHRGDWLVHVIKRVAKPDSAQMDQIRPIVVDTQNKLRTLESRSFERMTQIMDSLKMNLKPILTEEQNKNLEEFSLKARKRRGERAQ